jgi:hypothetical protein
MHPHFPAASARFQDHLVLETDLLFRIILYWTILSQVIKAELRYDVGSGTVARPIPPRRLPLALRVHMIDAVSRPTKNSRITNRRIIVDPPFRSQ